MKKTIILLLIITLNIVNAQTGIIDASAYNSIHDAINKNPNKMIFVPAGEYHIDKAIKLTTDGSGLYGYGTIIQDNPDEHIIVIENVSDVRVIDLTLKREKVEFSKPSHAIFVKNSQRVWLQDLRVLNNRATRSAVELQNSDYCRIQGCEIVNYKTITIDNRMKSDLYRYAFNAIDGHGIMVINCNATRIIGNSIIEEELHATKEMQEKYELGKIVERAEELGELAKYGVENNFVVIWHQGAGMRVTGNDETNFALVEGNYIENVAQGMDFHTDHLIVTNNRVTNAYMGMKAMHGSRNVLITDNIFQAPGKYGLLLRPGSSSHHASEAEGDKPAREANVEKGIIVSNNIFSDVGYGDEHWRLWNENPGLSYPVVIKLGYGPLEKNPVMTDVIIESNIIYDKGRDEVLVDGKPKVVSPKYKYAVWFDEEVDPANFHFRGNIFHSGSEGVTNKVLNSSDK